jgi:hypothetical protein
MDSSSQPLMLPSMLDVVFKLTTTNAAPLYLLAMALVRPFRVVVSPIAGRPRHYPRVALTMVSSPQALATLVYSCLLVKDDFEA